MKTLQLPANKLLLSAALAATLLLNPLSAAVHAAPVAVTTSTSYATEYGAFLKDKYSITVKEDGTITRGDLIAYVAALLPKATAESAAKFSDLDKTDALFSQAALLYDKGILNGPAVAAKQPLTNLAAILIALRASDLKELAYSYPEAKADTALTKAGINLSVLDLKTKQELAAAIDTGLLPASYQEKLVLSKPASSQLVQVLLGKIAAFQGNYKHYLGYVSEADIYTKIQDAYRTSNIIQIPNLQTVVDTALKQNVVTGYNLKDSRFDANFVEALSITYGHSNLQHIVQLIGLLRSEGLDAKVQLEPKTSAFIHMKEWGEPYESETAKVVKIENGNYITYAKEFDLKFEFNTVADKEKFQGIILKYAKKKM